MYTLVFSTGQLPNNCFRASWMTSSFRTLVPSISLPTTTLKYFPIPQNTLESGTGVVYENGWQDPRSYGGDRGHEGCDIMGDNQPAGFYPVVSITDGVIEKTGWLEQGGWRIGVRAPKGLYLYYAHLYGYARDWKEGDWVAAGTL